DAPPEGTDEAARQAIEDLARSLAIDRCGLALFTRDGHAPLWTPGFAMSRGAGWARLDLAAVLPWLTAQIRAGRPVLLSDLPGDLPAEAGAEAEFARAVGLRSHLALPLMAEGQ